jgi:hypothetical protein
MKTLWGLALLLVLIVTPVMARPGGGGGGTPRMGRLRTIGWETAAISSGTGGQAFEEGAFVAGCSIDTTTVRSGSGALKCDSGAGNVAASVSIATKAADQIFAAGVFGRVYVNLTNYPTTQVTVFRLIAGAYSLRVKLDTDGTLSLWNNNVAQIGSPSAALNTAQWYRIELYGLIDTGSVDAAELRLDGISIASATGQSFSDAVWDSMGIGPSIAPGANVAMYFDDFAMNNDQGATQNTWPGEGKIVLLKPVSDNAVGTGWVDGDGAGTLFGSVDNAPPIGSATPADGTQIKNLTGTATGNYDANVTSYTSAGITATDTITVVQSFVSSAEAITTGTKLGALQIVSNPAQAVEDSFTYGGDGTTAMGTWPSGWTRDYGAAQYNPSVTLGTSPVLRVGKRTNTTREVDVDCMGIYVEYIQGLPISSLRGFMDNPNLNTLLRM